MQRPPLVVPGPKPEDRVSWWEEWVEFVRGRPGQFDLINGEKVFWGEHLFLGWETHMNLSRARRAVGVKADMFTDGVEYEEVADLRIWKKTIPAPLLLHEAMLREHVYICGPTGTGKTSRGKVIPLLIQQMRGSKTLSGEVSKPLPIVICDFKGDSVLFHTAREEARRRGQAFRFFTIEKDKPTTGSIPSAVSNGTSHCESTVPAHP